MTDLPSSDDSRSRSDAASRLAALLSDVDEAEAAAGAPSPAPRRTIRPRSDRGDVEAPDLSGLALPGPGGIDSDVPDEIDLSALDAILKDLPGSVVADAEPPALRAREVAPAPVAPGDAIPEVQLPGDDVGARPGTGDDAAPTLAPLAAEDPDATARVDVLDLLDARLRDQPPADGLTESALVADPSGVDAVDDRGDDEEGDPGEPTALIPITIEPPAPEVDPVDGASGEDETAQDPPAPDDSTSSPPVPLAFRGRESPAPDDTETGVDDEPPVKLRRVTLRAVAFAVLLVLLVAAVPVLGLRGQERILNSRGGELVQASNDPSEPGYRLLVVPTQTALVLHRDDEGFPLSATVLSLGAGVTGGAVLQVPLETKVRNQRFYLDRLSAVYASGEDDELFFREVEDRLGVALGERVDVDDQSLAELVAPVAPLSIENPDPVATPEGSSYPAGPLTLTAEDVGPFLRATSEGESELGRLARNEIVWTAWLEAIGRAGSEDSVGVATTGIGPFLRVLADGTPEDVGTTIVETLDVTPPATSDQENPPLEPAPGMEEQIIDAVPYPLSPRLGRRFSLKLLNGANGSEVPTPLMHDLMLAGASLSTLGNADAFGVETTTIEISGDVWQEGAEAVRFVLDPDAEISVMSSTQAESEGVDMVVTLGSDVVDRFEEDFGG